jgi:hypothetical protein
VQFFLTQRRKGAKKKTKPMSENWLTKLKLGLLVNFNVSLIKEGIQRIVNNLCDFACNFFSLKNLKKLLPHIIRNIFLDKNKIETLHNSKFNINL